MLQVHNLHVVRTLYTATTAQFASNGNLELLRLAKLNDQLRCTSRQDAQPPVPWRYAVEAQTAPWTAQTHRQAEGERGCQEV
jgi:hypothetical protein